MQISYHIFGLSDFHDKKYEKIINTTQALVLLFYFKKVHER